MRRDLVALRDQLVQRSTSAPGEVAHAGSAAELARSRSPRASASASRARIFSTTAGGALASERLVAELGRSLRRLVLAAARSFVEPGALGRDVDRAGQVELDGDRRHRRASPSAVKLVAPAASSRASDADRRLVRGHRRRARPAQPRRAPAGAGLSPCSARNRRTSVTTAAAAARSRPRPRRRDARRRPPATTRSRRTRRRSASVHSSSVTNGTSGCSSRSSVSSTCPSTARVRSAAGPAGQQASLASSTYQSQTSSQAKW